ncbi:hypothetical protein I3760_13G101400 [Carya illinoinensis]|uniref:Homeobox domain-containing protein n=1 Tax=Carya illinoinensis TaxID=32201 RepID=A0A8T1NMK6_CARIL|nr:WUSCHEL-related homeobox 3-like [Carya illinoinensis]KAG2673646.1 hypothetical protein I3760_13G101400 [Carya illinoinensis]KAG6631615.1 hypothetical protein CIPAW_13G103200 [Carya illinoinensis]
MSSVASSRWCPTSEQLMILEEMYRSGIRTPNASQIQKITANLSFYGKIEGKNVFYWFQNHKARDRQKLRRKVSRQLQLQQQQQLHYYYQMNQSNDRFPAGYYESPSSSALQQLFFFDSSVSFLPQGGVTGASTQAMNHTWKVDMIPQRAESTMTTYGYDGNATVLEMGPISNCCTRPLQTLELFPVTATNLKEECSATSKQYCL